MGDLIILALKVGGVLFIVSILLQLIGGIVQGINQLRYDGKDKRLDLDYKKAIQETEQLKKESERLKKEIEELKEEAKKLDGDSWSEF